MVPEYIKFLKIESFIAMYVVQFQFGLKKYFSKYVSYTHVCSRVYEHKKMLEKLQMCLHGIPKGNGDKGK